ncbi:right-handed parallel beta-helix repeat-containing protein [Haloarcula sp. CBA1131]|uniref:right-handed parallel beta-helix repeat-containing protein n=1 Tax=Haloarcula sp. CBA1131 TaxID=1853686 RepID=UPI00178406D9|nr:right-handed parallel beta-helix repeat-containing protein [Haloarcula sp. CBA1131]
MAVILTVLLVTSPVVAAVPAGALTQAGNAGNTGTGAGNTGIGTGAGNTAVTPDPVVGSAGPTDPNGDGRFEDVNGDGSFDVVDSQALLAHLTNASVQNYSSSFDFTGDGRVTVSDGQWLYVQAVNPTETDADGDGLNNTVEIALGTNAFDTDTDSDGIGDWTETNGGKPIDTDSDGIIDARDADSDGDRIPDIREGTKDTDGDGTPNYRDTDDDGDGITTRTEALDGQNYSHDVDFDETVNWLDTDADGDGAPDGTEGTADSDGDGMPDYLDNDRDNDGLPDSYERNVTKTDPADNDSESPLTNYTEADNDVIDGMEDFDQDTLGTYVEYTIDTDPFVSDTDGDGLSDGFEYRNDQFDPLDADTDGDGTSDASGDLDGDGLTNGEEAQRGTLVDRPDTDGESLNDSREIELGTDPTLPDTDADGLDDDEELAIGTDPLDNDSDGDGVLDGNETFETATASDGFDLNISVTGNGNQADGISVSEATNPIAASDALNEQRVAPVVDITTNNSFENATITFQYNESKLGNRTESALSVARYNRTLQTYISLNSTVDAANNTISAETPHFSTYTVLVQNETIERYRVGGNPSSTYEFNSTDSLSDWNANGSVEVMDGSVRVGSPQDKEPIGAYPARLEDAGYDEPENRSEISAGSNITSSVADVEAPRSLGPVTSVGHEPANRSYLANMSLGTRGDVGPSSGNYEPENPDFFIRRNQTETDDSGRDRCPESRETARPITNPIFIPAGVEVPPGATIGGNSSNPVENTYISENVTIGANVTVLSNVTVAANVSVPASITVLGNMTISENATYPDSVAALDNVTIAANVTKPAVNNTTIETNPDERCIRMASLSAPPRGTGRFHSLRQPTGAPALQSADPREPTNFNSTQDAINASEPGDIIYVNRTGSGSLTIDKPLTIVGRGPETYGTTATRFSSITIDAEINGSVRLQNLYSEELKHNGSAAEITVENARIGRLAASHSSSSWNVVSTDIDRIFANNARGNWSITDSIAVQPGAIANQGLYARNSSGNWDINNSRISGIAAENSAANWSITNSNVFRTGIDAYGSSGSWDIRRTTIPDIGRYTTGGQTGIRASESSADWHLSRVEVDRTDFMGILARAASGNWTLNQVYINDTGKTGNTGAAVWMSGASGYWDINRTLISNSAEEGIFAAYSSANVTLRSVTVRDTAGLYLSRARGDWVLNRVHINGVLDYAGTQEYMPDGRAWERIDPQDEAIWAQGASGDVTLANVAITGKYTEGISARYTYGRWDIRSTTITDTLGPSIDMRSASSVSVSSSKLNSQVRARGISDSLSLSNTTIESEHNDGIELNPSTASVSLDHVAIDANRYGLFAKDSLGDISLNATRISVNVAPINARRTTGDWSLQNVELVQNFSAGPAVLASESSGTWSLRRANISAENGGISATDSNGDWTLANVSVDANADGIAQGTSIDSDGIAAAGSSGDWQLTTVKVTNASDTALNASASYGSWSLQNVSLANPLAGNLIPSIDAADSRGAWDISQTYTQNSIAAEMTTGQWNFTSSTVDGRIDASRKSGTWSLRGTSIAGSRGGLVSTASSGPTELRNVSIRSSTNRAPIEADSSLGRWAIESVELSGGNTAISAVDVSNDWEAHRIVVHNGTGITASGDGIWSVSNSTFSGDYAGIIARGTDSSWSVSNSQFSEYNGGAIRLSQNGSRADTRISNVLFEDVQNGVVLRSTGSRVTTNNIAVRNASDSGIYLTGSENTFQIRDSTFNNTNYALRRISDGTSSPEDVDRLDFAATNIDISGGGVGIGGSDWDLEHVRVDGARTGLNIVESNARHVTIRNTSTGVVSGRSVPGPTTVAGQPTITDSVFQRNGLAIRNTNEPPIQAQGNWWGQEGGPIGATLNRNLNADGSGQVVGDVDTLNPCNSNCLPPGAFGYNAQTSSITRSFASLASQRTPASVRYQTLIDNGTASIKVNSRDESTIVASNETSGESAFSWANTTVTPSQGTPTLSIETNGFARIYIDRVGLSLQQDTDGDGVPDHIERGFKTGTGEIIRTDPTDPDTDGDGVPDGEEIGDWIRLSIENESGTYEQSYYRLNSDPTAVDTDGDGLSDKTEQEGWNAHLATSPDQGERYENATKDESRDSVNKLTEVTVSSDPLYKDTDEDGVDDLLEHQSGIDPRQRDSDGDTIPDKKELQEGSDPAIHDHSAPVVYPLSVKTNNAQGTSYTVSFSVVDDSGYTTINIYKNGKRQIQVTEVNEEAGTYPDRTFNVDRGAVGTIITGTGKFFSPTTVDIETTDIHGNSKRQTISGPDTYGQAAREYEKLPTVASERGFISFMGYVSAGTTVGKESVVGIVEMVAHPLQYAEQMHQLGQTVKSNPAIVSKMPGMMADQTRQQHETRNPFDRGEKHYNTFGGAWSLGYSTGIVLPAAVTRGSSLGVQAVSYSRRLQRVVNAVDSAIPSRVPNGVRPGILRQAGKIDETLPNTNVRTGTLSAKLNNMPGPKRKQVTEQFDELDPKTKRYLSKTDVDAPATKSADLFRNAGPSGRKTLNDLADTDRRAADALLKMDDAATQRRFVKAHRQGEVSSNELATAVKRYDNLDASGKDGADDVLAATGDDGTEFLAEADDDTVQRAVADGGIDGYDRTKADLLADDSVDSAMVTRVDNRISELDGEPAERARDLVDDTDEAGVRLIDELDQADGDALDSFVEADLQGADMRQWRNALVRQSSDTDSPITSEDVAQYAQDVRDIQKLKGNDDIDIKNPERVVEETIEDPKASQIRGQKFEASRTKYYAEKHGDVTVEPATSGQGGPDLLVNRGSNPKPLYLEQKNVKGDLKGGLELKDRIHKADGSFNGISRDHDQVVEVGAEGDLPDDFNPTTTGTDTPKESFKELIRAKRNGEDINRLPKSLSGWDNPDMTVKIINDDGEVVDNGEFSIRNAYREVNNGN